MFPLQTHGEHVSYCRSVSTCFQYLEDCITSALKFKKERENEVRESKTKIGELSINSDLKIAVGRQRASVKNSLREKGGVLYVLCEVVKSLWKQIQHLMHKIRLF